MKRIALLAVIMLLSEVSAAQATEADVTTNCEFEECVFGMTTSGMEVFHDNLPIHTYSSGLGSGSGSIRCWAEYGEKKCVIRRFNSPTVFIYDVLAPSSKICSHGIGSNPNDSAVLSDGIYSTAPATDDVRRYATDCSGTFDTISVGDYPVGIETDGSQVIVVNQADDTLSTIANGAFSSVTHDIGLMAENLVTANYCGGTTWVNGSNLATYGLYSVNLTNDTNQWMWDLTYETGYMACDGGTHIVLAATGDSKVLYVDLATGATTETDVVVPTFVAVGDNYIFAVSAANGLEVLNRAGGIAMNLSANVASVSITKATPVVCGDNNAETGEDCDGSDLRGQDCTNHGFDNGTLACNSCSWDLSSCFNYVCGNDTQEGTEECDGTDLLNQDCTDHGFDAGTLSCSSCSWNTTSCFNYVCGNDTQEGTEECDGTDLLNQDCTDHGFDAGTLSCSSCSWNTTSCFSYVCGDGNQEGTEECDGGDLNGQDCTDHGFAGGSLACNAGSCTFDTNACTMCGNNTADTGEDCDGSDLRGMSCASLGLGTGTLACAPSTCNWITSGCSLPPVCGDSSVDPGEDCDNGNSNSDTQPDACRTDCSNPGCGDNVIDTGETCDDGNTNAGDGCDAVCQIEPGCGNGQIDAGEDCDDGNGNSDTEPDACRTDCSLASCGDGIIDTGEACDDLNLTAGDGCSQVCNIEDGYECTGEPSACSESTCNAATAGITMITDTSIPLQHPTLVHGVLEEYNTWLTRWGTNITCKFECGETAGKARLSVSSGSNWCIFKKSTITYIIARSDDTGEKSVVFTIDNSWTPGISWEGDIIKLHDSETAQPEFLYGTYGNEEVSLTYIGTSSLIKSYSVHPDPDIDATGRFALGTVPHGKVGVLNNLAPGAQFLFGVEEEHQSFLLNLNDVNLNDAGYNLPDTDDKKKKGCNQSGARTTPLWFLMVLFILIVLKRKQLYGCRVRIK